MNALIAIAVVTFVVFIVIRIALRMLRFLCIAAVILFLLWFVVPSHGQTIVIPCACEATLTIPAHRPPNHNGLAIAITDGGAAAAVTAVWLLHRHELDHDVQMRMVKRPLFSKAFVAESLIDGAGIALDGYTTFRNVNKGGKEFGNPWLYGRYPTARSYLPPALGIGVILGAASWQMERSRHRWVRTLSHIPLLFDAGTHFAGAVTN